MRKPHLDRSIHQDGPGSWHLATEGVLLLEVLGKMEWRNWTSGSSIESPMTRVGETKMIVITDKLEN